MHQLLQPGKPLTIATGQRIQVDAFLGGGGQGEVYRVTLNAQPLALKWYFPQQATAAQRAAIAALVQKGSPGPAFLWPLELVEPGAGGAPAGFGYLMPLREPRFKGLVDLMKRRVEPGFRALTLAGLQLAQAFLSLHAQGLCYRDISFGNVFLDPDTGAIAVCDNDNVAVDGAGHHSVDGTPRFIAPEVVRGEAAPGTQTDLFSLALLLFYLFHLHHPLEGRRESAIRCLDLPAMKRLYGREPLFIFDPDNADNRPVPGLHDNALAYWPLYPAFLREAFTRAFTSGLHAPLARVRESEWRALLARLADSLFYCGHCGAENFYDGEALRANGGAPGACWACRRPLTLPFRLRLGSGGAAAVVMLNHDTRLYPHHLDPDRCYDFGAPLAQVQRHPTDPNRWGLLNLGADKWVLTGADGTLRDIEPGRSAGLSPGVRLQFGRRDGEIGA